MNIDTSIDLGDKSIQLLEKLAAQLGTTMDKVFPWYVKQAVVMGCMGIGIWLLILAITAWMMQRHLPKADFRDGNKSTIYVIVGWMSIFVLSCMLLGEGASTVAQIVNPEYAAMKVLLEHLAGLRP